MRRKQGTGLVKNEILLLQIASLRQAAGDLRFHGYDLVQTLVGPGGKPTMSQPTLYRALRRLEESGHLTSEWETLEEASADDRDGRPRRYYRLTTQGSAAVSAEDTHTAGEVPGI